MIFNACQSLEQFSSIGINRLIADKENSWVSIVSVKGI